MKKVNQQQAIECIAAKEPFDANSLKGDWFGSNGWPSTGRLPRAFKADLIALLDAGEVFVVSSYATPIAWFANGEWTMPTTNYSVTTKKHQTLTKRGIK